MGAIKVTLPDALMAMATRLATERDVPLEALAAEVLTAALAGAGLSKRLAPLVLQNPSHRHMLAPLDRPADYYASPGEEVNDREKARAETYAESRARLLALIDSSEGDMGAEGWSRARAYDR